MWREDKNIRIRHLRQDGKYYGTVIYGQEGNYVNYGLAIVSEKDNPVKERGRQIAYGRYLYASRGYEDVNKLDSPLHRRVECPLKKLGQIHIEDLKDFFKLFRDLEGEDEMH